MGLGLICGLRLLILLSVTGLGLVAGLLVAGLIAWLLVARLLITGLLIARCLIISLGLVSRAWHVEFFSRRSGFVLEGKAEIASSARLVVNFDRSF